MTSLDTPTPDRNAMSPLRLIALGVLVVGVILTAVFGRQELWRVLNQAEALGAIGAVLIVLVYIVACVLMLPGSPLTLATGAVFGVWIALPIISAGATLGACAAFLVGRFIARDWISRRLAGSPKFAAIDHAVGDKGFTLVLLTRLSPIFPFNLQNYAYSLTGIPFWKYALASWLGMLPGTLMYVYIGAVFGQAARGEKTAAQWTLYAAGLAATVIAALLVARIARNALSQITERELK
jgi:uncharacterized membrane protein YdjX (TVP38/TMEM64 family)